MHGYLSLAQLTFFAACLNYGGWAGTLFNLVILVIACAFTCITFARLRQTNQLLLVGGNRINQLTLSRFARSNTAILLSISAFNPIAGGFILGFVATTLPINTYLLVLVFMGSFLTSTLTRALLMMNILTQWIVIFGFHLLAARYSSQMHACAKRLLYFVSSQLKRTRWGPTLAGRERIMLALLLEKYHTRKRYGITYGSFGLISFASFAKVCNVISMGKVKPKGGEKLA